MAKRTEAQLKVISNINRNVIISTIGTKAAPGSKIISYALVWGDGSSNVGVGKPPERFDHSYEKNGSYDIHLTVSDNKGRSDTESMGMIVHKGTEVPPIPPVDPTVDLWALSPDPVHVQNAIDLAVSGMVVGIPNGSAVWNQGVSINGKAITLTGESEGGVTFIDNLPDGGFGFVITESIDGHIILKNLKFDSRTKNHGSSTGAHVLISGVTGGRAVIAHHNTHLLGDGWNFAGIDAYHILVNRGLFHHNTITATFVGPAYLNGIAAFRIKLPEGPFGLAQWESPSTLGILDTTGELNVYMEDNILTGCAQGTDFDDSCRVVFRYNTCMDFLVLSHGFDSSPYGSRQVEIYQNSLGYGDNTVFDPILGNIPMNVSSMIGMRGGGVWRITDNLIADPSTPGSLWGARNAMLFEMYTLRGNPYCELGAYPIYHQQARGHNGVAYFQDPTYIWNNTKLTTPWVAGGGPSDAPSVHNTDSCRPDGKTTADFVVLGRDFFLSDPGTYTPYTYPHPLQAL
jgi:PKD repeat protein